MGGYWESGMSLELGGRADKREDDGWMEEKSAQLVINNDSNVFNDTLVHGITIETLQDVTIYYIRSISDDLKKLIRDYLSSICHGKKKADKHLQAYSYKKTVTEFIKRFRNSDDENRKKGMIGELLFHLIMAIFKNYFKPASILFNLEENSFKKGFDACFFKEKELWIAEVKSGGCNNPNSPDKAIINLINRAKIDLNKRLNSKETHLWLNAINHAESAMKDNDDDKDAVLQILDQCYENEPTSADKNVILCSVLLHRMSTTFSKQSFSESHQKIKDSMIFNQSIIIAIQNSEIEELHSFLESESKDE